MGNPMKNPLVQLFRSVRNGIAGVVQTARTEANMRWHLAAAVAVLVSGFIFPITLIEWALVVGCIAGVLAVECLNTGIEHLADRVTAEQDPLIKKAKDAGAAAVLLSTIAAALIGGLIFIPRILAWL